MAENDLIEMDGEVTDTFRGGVFIVKTSEETLVQCKPSGKMRMNNIGIVIGDKVIIQVSPYDLTQGRIVKRLK